MVFDEKSFDIHKLKRTIKDEEVEKFAADIESESQEPVSDTMLEWLEDKEGQKLSELKEHQNLSGQRLSRFEVALEDLRSLWKEWKDVRDTVTLMAKEPEVYADEIENTKNQLAELTKEVEEKGKFVEQEYRDVYEHQDTKEE